MVSSIMNRVYTSHIGINYDQLSRDSEKLPTNAFRRYSETKLATILFSRELTKQMKLLPNVEDRDRVIGVSLHPGMCFATKFYRSTSYLSICTMLVKSRWQGTGGLLLKEKAKSLSQSAATTIYCALHPDIEGGQHYADCKVNDVIHEMALDENEWKKCWDFTESQIEQKLQS